MFLHVISVRVIVPCKDTERTYKEKGEVIYKATVFSQY